MRRPRKPYTLPKCPHLPPRELTVKFGRDLIGRALAAFLIGISRSELIRREQIGLYSFIKDSRGRAWFDENYLKRILSSDPRAMQRFAQLEESRIRKAKKVKTKMPKGIPGSTPASLPKRDPRANYSAKQAAAVFMELGKGTLLVDIIQILDIHPEAALAIQEVYARVAGGMYLDARAVAELRNLPIRGSWGGEGALGQPSPSGFVDSIRLSLTPPKCARCSDRPARICAACAGKRDLEPSPRPAPPPSPLEETTATDITLPEGIEGS